MEKRRPRFQKRPRYTPQHCFFCEAKTEPDYKDPATLGKFVSERGKILSREKTGLCNRHQRKITSEIKRARVVALMPFVVRA